MNTWQPAGRGVTSRTTNTSNLQVWVYGVPEHIIEEDFSEPFFFIGDSDEMQQWLIQFAHCTLSVICPHYWPNSLLVLYFYICFLKLLLGHENQTFTKLLPSFVWHQIHQRDTTTKVQALTLLARLFILVETNVHLLSRNNEDKRRHFLLFGYFVLLYFLCNIPSVSLHIAVLLGFCSVFSTFLQASDCP